MTLKYIDINGRGVLVDESAEIKEEICIRYVQDIPYVMKYDKGIDHKQYPIICAEKELNLDVPILPNWREWEVKQLAIKDLENYFGSNLELNEKGKLWVEGYTVVYNHNKAKYTEEDILDAWELGAKEGLPLTKRKKDNLLKSLQKLPKYIVMESVVINIPNFSSMNYAEVIKPKLITNSEGKQEGIIKEIIY